ncbi:MAG: hypothetical protein HKN29_13785 [Rhodothermales bacterium]|nr:hypothetical protein [Rhodothermales bacterium]
MTDGNNRTTRTFRYKVRAHEADSTGAARPDVLCDYLQDAAANHADHLELGATQLVGEGLAWVLARLVLEVQEMPRWQDEVAVTTWPSGRQGIFATRDFEVSVNDRITARATTAWFLIDISRRRPARLPEVVTSLPLPERPRSLVDDFGRIPRIGNATETAGTRRAAYTDIDMNRHVNHVRYLAWAMDAMESDWLAQHQVRRLEMQFKNEAVMGQHLRTMRAPLPDSESTWIYEVQGEDGGLVSQTRIDWRPR